jgi:hypothetical protein
MGNSMTTDKKILGKSAGNVEVPAHELNQEEKRALYAEAMKAVAEEVKEKESARLLEEYKKLARRELIPEEELHPVTIDLAGHSTKISVDGTDYFQGVTYHFTAGQAASIREIAFRGWKHEREIGGANSNAYRRPHNLSLSVNDSYNSPSHLMRM